MKQTKPKVIWTAFEIREAIYDRRCKFVSYGVDGNRKFLDADKVKEILTKWWDTDWNQDSLETLFRKLGLKK